MIAARTPANASKGQLWFRGPSVTQGYYRNESATAALFPQGAAAGWVNSGDRAYRAEGEIYITGRVKDIIIHAGQNLYPHEIEDAVAQVPGVRKGCVVAFGAADPKTGTERLVVVAETRERDPAARARIAQAITAQVSAALGLPPDVVEVVPPNAIPKTSSGKLQRDATKKRFLSGELGSESAAGLVAGRAAGGGIERWANSRGAAPGGGDRVRLLCGRDVRGADFSRHGCWCCFRLRVKWRRASRQRALRSVSGAGGLARARRRPRAYPGKCAAHVRLAITPATWI